MIYFRGKNCSHDLKWQRWHSDVDLFPVTPRTTDSDDPVEMAGNQAELAALIKRLESVTLRLEKVPGGGPAQDGGIVWMLFILTFPLKAPKTAVIFCSS